MSYVRFNQNSESIISPLISHSLALPTAIEEEERSTLPLSTGPTSMFRSSSVESFGLEQNPLITLTDQLNGFSTETDSHRVAIIGMGPRGLYAFERIVAVISEFCLKKPICIHVFESSELGAGSTYATSQPHYLKLNTISSQITAYWDGSIQGVGPVTVGPTLYEWLVSQGINISPNEYPSRAQHGQYLAAVAKEIQERIPNNVKLVIHQSCVIDIQPVVHRNNKDWAVRVEDNPSPVLVQKILITTGHSTHLSPYERELINFASQMQCQGHHETKYISIPYPIQERIYPIQSSSTIGIQGMGLTAIDVIIAATIGRGGKFQLSAKGELRYIKSGLEPKLVAWSRSGVPLSARAKNQKGVAGRYVAKFLTLDRISVLRTEAIELRNSPKLDFDREVMPILLQDLEYVYYSTLKGKEFGERYLQVASDVIGRVALLEEIPMEDRFNWEALSRPTRRLTFITESEYRIFLMNYLMKEKNEAEKGNLTSALKAASEVLRDIRDNIRSVVDYGGLLPISHQSFDQTFTAINNRISVGPPYFRYEQMIALIKADVLDFFVGPSPKIILNAEKHCFDIQGLGETRSVDVLVNGVLPTPDIRTDQSALSKNLLSRGLIRPFENKFEDHSYIPGGVDINTNSQLIGLNGEVNPDLSLLGVPTEGTLLYTTIAARPMVNSRAIADAGRWAVRVLNELKEKENVECVPTTVHSDWDKWSTYLFLVVVLFMMIGGVIRFL